MEKTEVKLLLGSPTVNLRIWWLRLRPAPGALFIFFSINLKQVTFMLVERLERIPADSIWAHRASGVRGSLIRMLEDLEAGVAVDLYKHVKMYNRASEFWRKPQKKNGSIEFKLNTDAN
jgi:hypothetical protein